MLWFIPQGPDLSQFVDFFSAGPWLIPRDPIHPGALTRPAGPWLAPRGSGWPNWALIRSAGPWFVLLGPGLSCGALICPEGPDPSREALKSDRESTSTWGPSGSMGPALT